MEKIDFASFNKPKHFPQWLCSGDPLRLAEYDDAQLEELDNNIRSLGGQFDIDNASGAELDRIGKILDQERNGNDDRIYRIYLKLKTMLNTANGTIEDIIKFVKFFFSSEIVHLVPNYPAGLRILHDGWNDEVDFNRVVRQIVGAGIEYDTRELFNMTEEFPFGDKDEKKILKVEKEPFFRNTVLRDGRVLRDGVTVFPTHLVPYQYKVLLLRDGQLVRNGTEKRSKYAWREGLRREPADSAISTPIHRNAGILDFVSLRFRKMIFDYWQVEDSFSFDNIEQAFSDKVDISDADQKKAVTTAIDTIGRNYKRNGSLVRDGVHRRASDRIVDFASRFSMSTNAEDAWAENDAFELDGVRQSNVENFTVRDESEEGFFGSFISDGIGRRYTRNGKLRRNGGAYRSSDRITDPSTMTLGEEPARDNWNVSDAFESGKRWWFFRDGRYHRDSGITRKSGVLEAI